MNWVTHQINEHSHTLQQRTLYILPSQNFLLITLPTNWAGDVLFIWDGDGLSGFF